MAGHDYSIPMKTNTYARAMKSVLSELVVVVTHYAHLGRQLGAKILEMLEIESEEIRRLGNWNPSMQDSSYSTKLPMKPIRRLAGFSTSGGLYYNPRTALSVPMQLQQMTPIGKWVFNALDKVKAANSAGGQLFTAQNFLEFLVTLNIVFVQDMATLIIEHATRVHHHKGLDQLNVLRSDEFLVRYPKYSPPLLTLLTLLVYMTSALIEFRGRYEKTTSRSSISTGCNFGECLAGCTRAS